MRAAPLTCLPCPPAEISICKRVDGRDWQLGAGAFGRVYKALRDGVAEVAVKVGGVWGGCSAGACHLSVGRPMAEVRSYLKLAPVCQEGDQA